MSDTIIFSCPAFQWFLMHWNPTEANITFIFTSTRRTSSQRRRSEGSSMPLVLAFCSGIGCFKISTSSLNLASPKIEENRNGIGLVEDPQSKPKLLNNTALLFQHPATYCQGQVCSIQITWRKGLSLWLWCFQSKYFGTPIDTYVWPAGIISFAVGQIPKYIALLPENNLHLRKERNCRKS